MKQSSVTLLKQEDHFLLKWMTCSGTSPVCYFNFTVAHIYWCAQRNEGIFNNILCSWCDRR